MRAWAAPPTLHIAGLRVKERVYVRATHYARHRCAQNADHLAHNTPFSAFFTEVVCVLGASPPQAATSQPQNGGNDAIQAPDTPMTRRQRASHGANPPTTTDVWGARNTRGATSSNTRRDGSRAGRHPPAHTAARPSKQPGLTKHTRRPEHPWGRKQQPGKTKTADPEGSAVSSCARGELNPHSITGTRT